MALWTLIAALVVLCTLLPLWQNDTWWVRAWDFPRAQIAGLAVVALATRTLLGPVENLPQRALLGLLTASLLFQLWRIFPYTPLARVQSLAADSSRPGGSLSLMISNVLMDNRNAEPLLALVREKDPDLLFAAETDEWWVRELSVLRERYPYQMLEPLDDTYGMALFSRFEIFEPKVRFLIEDDVPSFHLEVEPKTGRRVRLHFLHPRPPFPTESLETKPRDAEILIVGREVGSNGEPTIVAGDLNDVAWSHTTRLFQRVSALLDPRIGRGLYSTFHAENPLLRWPLDHVFHSDHFKLVSLDRLQPVGSDHFPIFAHLQLESLAPLEQQAPLLEPGDLQETFEIIEEGDPDLSPPPTTQEHP